jgi:serine/threonine protein phosphatase PrpC
MLFKYLFTQDRTMPEIGSALDVGLKRRGNENQDSLLVLEPTLFNRKPPLLVVADGMGGYHGGALASQTVVKTFQDVYQKAHKNENLIDVLYKAVLLAHQNIIALARQDPQLDQMGSTVVAVALDGDVLYLTNVGDSRAYLISAQEIEQINWDHSLVADLLRANHLTAEEASNYPRKNVLTMSISAQRGDLEPYTLQRRLDPDQHVLLCSDGLWGCVSEEQIQRVVLQFPAAQAAARLVEMANANQGPDNISVIIARRTQ